MSVVVRIAVPRRAVRTHTADVDSTPNSSR